MFETSCTSWVGKVSILSEVALRLVARRIVAAMTGCSRIIDRRNTRSRVR